MEAFLDAQQTVSKHLLEADENKNSLHCDISLCLCLRQCSAAEGIVFSACSWLCAWVCPCCWHSVLKSIRHFHQTFSISAVWYKDEHVKFWDQRSKFKVTVGPTCWKMHFMALLVWHLENSFTEFHQTFSIDASWDKDERFSYWVKRSKVKVATKCPVYNIQSSASCIQVPISSFI